MSILTKEKINAIITDTKDGKITWSGSIENEGFSASYENVRLAVMYGTKYHPVGNPMLMMGINYIDGEHKSELLDLNDRKDPRWKLVYSLWESVVKKSCNKSAA